MNNKRLISLTICWILAVVPGLCVLSFAGIESGTNTEAEQHFEKANELRKLADYDAAITEYKKVISLSPKSKIAQDAQYWIGQSYFEAGQFDAALSAFQKLLDEYPTSTIIPSTKLMMERVQQAKKNKSLFEAVKKGDIEQVKKLIAEGADVNETEDLGQVKWTPLIAAASGGDVQVVKVLLENGAKVDATDSHGYTPLYYAIWSDNEETVKALVSGGADINKSPANDKDYPPLVYAIWQGHKGNVEIMLDAGADINTKDEKGYTPLYWAAFTSEKDVFDLILTRKDYPNTVHLAACKGDLDRVTMLIEGGTDVNVKDEFGCTPLHWAALADSPAVAGFLIAKGADVNAKHGRGYTPLMTARALPVVELLISKGADIQGQDALQGQTKLHMACVGGEKDVADLLIRRGADVNLRDKRGATPLWIAARGGHKEIVELLIEKGADINASDGRREATPLLIAARSGHADVVELLIAKGADVNVPDNQGLTPLAMAKQGKHTEVVNVLRQHGAVETLHAAIASGDIDEVKRLISQGADINAKNENGQTPLLLALNSNQMDVAELLVARGADVEAIDDRTGKALLLSVGGRKERVEFLLSKGANIETKDGNGLTLLQLMAAYSNQKDYLDVIELLLEKGADIETRGYADCTPLQTVAEAGRKEAAELLLAHGAKVDAAPSKFYGTTYHQAMRGGHPDMVRWCLSKGMDIPPLHQAAYFGETEKVRSLLNKGADVNQEDVAGFTALHCAVFGRNKEIVELLIDKGADVRDNNAFNASLLFWACGLAGDLDIVKLLVENGAEVNGRGFEGMKWGSMLFGNYTNLHRAAHTGHAHIVEYLLDKGANINATCTRWDAGFTPLHFAARKGHLNVVKVLLAKGADANLKTKEGRTALDFAKEKNHTDVIELLHKHGAKK